MCRRSFSICIIEDARQLVTGSRQVKGRRSCIRMAALVQEGLLRMLFEKSIH